MTQQRLAYGDIARPQLQHWQRLCSILRTGDPKSPPICFILEGDAGDGVILYLDSMDSNRAGRDSSMFYDKLEDSTDYQTSREGKAHVLACGLIEWAAIESRKQGDFEAATWLDEQQHQVDAGNYNMCMYLRAALPHVMGSLF